MTLIAGIITLAVITAAALLIIRMGAIALAKTGLSHDVAGFQSLSAFFGVGFTTSEAELVMSHPVRRRIIRDLMLVGNLGLMSGFATVIATVVQSRGLGGGWPFVVLVFLMALMFGLYYASNRRAVRRLMDRLIERTLIRRTGVRALDYEILFRVGSGYEVSEVEIGEDHRLVGRTLAKAQLRQHGVLVVGIVRSNDAYVGVPTGQTEIRMGDVLVVYGQEGRIKEQLRSELGEQGQGGVEVNGAGRAGDTAQREGDDGEREIGGWTGQEREEQGEDAEREGENREGERA